MDFVNTHKTSKIFSAQLPNIGITSVKFTDEELVPIVEEINKIKSNFNAAQLHNDYLAGHIKHEYTLTNSLNHLETIMFPAVNEFIKTFNWYERAFYLKHSTAYTIKLNSLWVNFQEKYEFNPLHEHSGAISFVLWLSIPFNYDNEQRYFGNISEKQVGRFNFHYTNTLGKIETAGIPADASFNNIAVIFPSQMAHSVNPFYSDGVRVSVSGNWMFTEIPPYNTYAGLK